MEVKYAPNLRLVEISGYVVVEEAATDVAALENALGREEPWSERAFIDKVITLQRRRQNTVRAAGSIVFFDRSFRPPLPGESVSRIRWSSSGCINRPIAT